MQKRLKIPKDWTFQSPDVAKNFDSHVREQLPWYEMLTRVIGLIARHFIRQNGVIYDIGCSTGNIGRELQDTIRNRNAKLIALDNSAAMKDKFTGPGEFVLADAVSFDYQPFDLAILYLIVQFIPLEQRRPMLERIVAQCSEGGAVILVDKYSPDHDSPYIQTIKRRITLLGKTMSGTPSDEIVAKELSLSGVQRPLDSSLFEGIGIRRSEFFRFGEFIGWILYKSGS